jgi:hypothetical protein
MNASRITASTLLAALAATNAIGQTTIPGDVVVAPGGTLIINDNTTYTGTLTIGAGAQVVIDTGFRIFIEDGATMTVNGTAAEPVDFFPINGSWEGVRFLDGSSADISHAAFMDFRVVAIEADGADLSMTGVEIFDGSSFPVTHTGTRYGVISRNGGNLSFDKGIVGPMTGAGGGSGGTGGTNGTGGSGSSGRSMTAIDARNIDSLNLTNSVFIDVNGGRGGNGGTGGRGSNGGNGSNGTGSNGSSGGNAGDGRTGGTGGTGGAGGTTTVLYTDGVTDIMVAQNIVDRISGGLGGSGAPGGRGGNGGHGGDGGDGGAVGDGGDAGDGGDGGRGGRGGRGGNSGVLQVFRFINPGTEPVVANNTVFEATAAAAGASGVGGSGGTRGTGGDGGEAGLFGDDGSDGSNGSNGSTGSAGSLGAHGAADTVITTGFAVSGLSAMVHNNIFTFTGPGIKRAAYSTDSGIIDITTNAFSGFDTLNIGPAIGGLSVITDPPVFVDASMSDFTLAEMSPGVDAGDNALVPAGFEFDFLGNIRFADDTNTPDTGMGVDYIVDMGAIERPGETPSGCLPDVNGDGEVTPTDFTAWINAFNNNLPGCDQNGDGACTPTDFSAWINNFNNGCD